MGLLTIKDVLKNKEVKHLLEASAVQMKSLGYTEHSFRHCRLVSNKCGEILEALGYPERTVELGRIAGYLHDIGNAVNRSNHEQSGAVLAYDFLRRYDMDCEEAIVIMMAIANHDEGVGVPVNPVAAALILSDKADVHRSRVTNRDHSSFDIHDRVNYAVTQSTLNIDAENKQVTLDLEIDTKMSAMMDYFEIFLMRMKMCRNAARFFNLDFVLIINQVRLL
ncbi:MAG: HD domain-containing protein [Ruminococcaceae bacterium]|jgi:metal-dependent HD superfamily phosphatase/phosphodiesterase|nr:HD domain-containing protein [Oscillospiraceae bacterium]